MLALVLSSQLLHKLEARKKKRLRQQKPYKGKNSSKLTVNGHYNQLRFKEAKGSSRLSCIDRVTSLLKLVIEEISFLVVGVFVDCGAPATFLL